MMMIVFEGDISKEHLVDRLFSEGLVFHKTGKPFTLSDAEEALEYTLGQEYVEWQSDVPNTRVLKATERTTRELPFLKRIEKHSHPSPPAT